MEPVSTPNPMTHQELISHLELVGVLFNTKVATKSPRPLINRLLNLVNLFVLKSSDNSWCPLWSYCMTFRYVLMDLVYIMPRWHYDGNDLSHDTWTYSAKRSNPRSLVTTDHGPGPGPGHIGHNTQWSALISDSRLWSASGSYVSVAWTDHRWGDSMLWSKIWGAEDSQQPGQRWKRDFWDYNTDHSTLLLPNLSFPFYPSIIDHSNSVFISEPGMCEQTSGYCFTCHHRGRCHCRQFCQEKWSPGKRLCSIRGLNRIAELCLNFFNFIFRQTNWMLYRTKQDLTFFRVKLKSMESSNDQNIF